MVVCECLVAQSCLTLCDHMDCSPPGSSVHGLFQARVLEQVAIFYARGSSDPEIKLTSPACPALAVRFFYHCATWEAQYMVVVEVEQHRVQTQLVLNPISTTFLISNFTC